MRRLACFAAACLPLVLLSPVCRAAPQRPALVVVVSIDQFPYEYLERMRAGFDAHGMFNRFRSEGATLINCHHGHAFTYTAPGHSVLLTGAFPNVNGIIGNEWFDRATGQTVYCVQDDRYKLVGNPLEMPAKAKGVSPRPLLAGTLGDVLKLADPRSKVFGVSLKDRAGVLMTGQLADGVYWFDAKTGNWITSSYYRPELPGYLRTFNESDAAEAYVGKSWEPLLEPEQYTDYYGRVKMAPVPSLNTGFPHPMPEQSGAKYYSSMTLSPFGNALTLQAARLLLTYEKLGQDDAPDLLAINLASNDFVGHRYGPHSLEAQDITYRTDRLLAELADFIQQQMAGRPWVMALSSDHGVGPVPEYAQALGLPAARNPLGSTTALRDQLEAKLRSQLGQPQGDQRYIDHLDGNSVYLHHALPQLAGDHILAAQHLVRDALVELPGVAVVFTREELLAQDASGKSLALAFERSFNAARSGDVLYALAPYNINGGTPATHGSPWEYDSHVPLLFWGFGIRPGEYTRSVAPAALAPTLARLLRVDAPSCSAVEAIYEVLVPASRPAGAAPLVPQT
ncbi:MAG TPA: alkaline phosphatase family protein [Pirellulales bacterium]